MRSSDNPYAIVTDSAGRGAVYEGHGPQAVYEERSDSTYIVYRGPNADPYATRFDHETATIDEPVRIDTNPLGNDDNHGPPSICIDDDGFVTAFYGSHGSHHHLSRTSEPFDVSAWESLGTMDDVPGGTYPSPIVYEGDIYVLYRAGPGWDDREYPSAQFATIARSSDRGRSFEDLGPILDVTDHPGEISIAYVTDIEEQDGRFHVTWFICHDHAAPVTAASQHRSGIYHALYDPTEDALYSLDGSRFDTPLTWEDMQRSAVCVFDRQDVNHPKLAVSEGGPEILFTHYDPATVHLNDGTSRIEWLVSSWEGRWRTERIENAFATHLFDGGYPRISESGEFEAHIITGGSDPALVDDRRGGNFSVARRTDEGWECKTVAAREDVGQPVSRVSTVANGRDAFASLFVPASDDPAAFDLRLFAYGTTWETDS